MKKGIELRWYHKLFGYVFVANIRTKEIHDAKSDCHCFRNFASHNQMFLTKGGMIKLLKGGFNGCRFCLNEHNNG